MIELMIDGKKVTAQKGETVLKVAQRYNIYIPTLCYHKDLSPYGGCRLCIVEVEGWPLPVASCTLPAQEGLKVKTDTPLLKDLRRFTLQLILSEHPHACLICDRKEDCAHYMECIQKAPITFGCKFCPSNNDCELQTLVDYLEIKDIPFDFHYRSLMVERYDPFFERDYNLCILCGRCVRMCQEVRGAATLDFHHRGPDTLVGTAFRLPHLETGCQFCGACVDVCPTGALRERYGKWQAKSEKSVRATCALCNIGCSINLNIDSEGKLVSSTPDNNQICVRGRFGIVPMVYHARRLTRPLMKKDNRLVEVEWEEALSYVASKLDEHRGKTGLLFGSHMTIEALESLYRLADDLRCSIAAPLDIDGKGEPLKLKEFKDESVFLVVNTDMIRDFSPLLLMLRMQSKIQSTIIVIDSLENKFTNMADLWLQPKPGKEFETVSLLFGRGKKRNTTGISHETLERCKDILKKRNVYVLYNPAHSRRIDVPKSVRTLPLYSSINTLKICELGTDGSVDDILKKKTIDCLYAIGVLPRLQKGYKTVIVQNCFPPPFEFDVFLPTVTFVEMRGSVINIEGKVKKVRRAIDPVGKSKPDDWIFQRMSEILKYDIKRRRPRQRKKKLSRVFEDMGTSKKYPVNLLVRENCYMYQGHPLSSLMKGFQRLRDDTALWISVDVAKKLRIKDNMHVRVISRNINLELHARVSDNLPENSVLIYNHPFLGVDQNQAVRIECITKETR